MPSTVTVYYPFHPLAIRRLEVITWPRRQSTAVTIQHPDGTAAKIPLWMVQPEAARFQVGGQIGISTAPLMAVINLLAVSASSTVTQDPHRKRTNHAADQLPVPR